MIPIFAPCATIFIGVFVPRLAFWLDYSGGFFVKFRSMNRITRFSKKRRDMLEIMRSGALDHPTAMEVFLRMRKVYPNISLGTVYRNLKCLCDSGDIVQLDEVADCDRFDHNTHPHAHLVCEKCGRVVDVPISDELLNGLGEGCGVSVKSVKIILTGRCPHCR